MHESHRKAPEQHELAAHAHRTAAERNEKRNTKTGTWLAASLRRETHANERPHSTSRKRSLFVDDEADVLLFVNAALNAAELRGGW
jgi:hypothetical protein